MNKRETKINQPKLVFFQNRSFFTNAMLLYTESAAVMSRCCNVGIPVLPFYNCKYLNTTWKLQCIKFTAENNIKKRSMKIIRGWLMEQGPGDFVTLDPQGFGILECSGQYLFNSPVFLQCKLQVFFLGYTALGNSNERLKFVLKTNYQLIFINYWCVKKRTKISVAINLDKVFNNFCVNER